MRVFISSVIAGFEQYRGAARDAVDDVRKAIGTTVEPVMAEKDYPSLSASPQEACLTGAKTSDVFILLLGKRYGWVNPNTRLSATHEEYIAARHAGVPILVFVQEIRKEAKQQAFENQVADYTEGRFRTTFQSPDGLRFQVQRALREFLSSRGLADEKQRSTTPQYTQNIHGDVTTVIQKIDTLHLNSRRKNK